MRVDHGGNILREELRGAREEELVDELRRIGPHDVRTKDFHRPDWTPTRGAVPRGSSCAQGLAKVPPQRIEVNIFDGRLDARVPVLPRAPRRNPHPLPVGRTIHRAPEALPLDKALQHHHRVPIFGPPVSGNPPADLRQNPTPQSRHPDPR